MRTISLLFTLFFIPVIAQGAQKTHLRGERYCEIILAQTNTQFAVYNTIGLNNCPENTWKHITEAEVKKETGAAHVHLNGPRYWVIDDIQNSSLVNQQIKTIAGLAMREAGVLHLGLLDLLKPNKPYKQRKVARKTTWVYEAGKPVYELIDPQGSVFVMQSYSIQKTPQTELSLQQLGTQLKLPEHWQFKTGILKKSEALQAIDNMAVVVQDSFLNTYQKATHDFLGTQ